MKKVVVTVAVTVVVLVSLGIYFLISRLNEGFNYKGICLFDIDNTLTLGTENYEVVQLCLDAGYAVGISTANSSYSPESIKSKEWMPKNLYDFMVQTQFNTFNNVSTFYLNGKIQPDPYTINQPSDHVLGWRKGVSLLSTANLYGITDPKRMILFDDDRDYLKGILSYNNKVKAVCSGPDCGGSLNRQLVIQSIQN